MATTATVVLKVADMDPVKKVFAAAGDLADASAALLTTLANQEVWPPQAASLREAVGEFRATLSLEEADFLEEKRR